MVTIPNQEYKGPRKRKKIKTKNPNYQGKWKVPMIDNLENISFELDFKDDPYLLLTASSTLVLSCGRYILKTIPPLLGWNEYKLVMPTFFYLQVKSGTLFDNIIIADDPVLVKPFAEETWGKHKEVEKAAFDEAEIKKEEGEAAKAGDDEDDDLD
ncbi:hypothetical protein EJB05_34570, partial [Eragrostis curvula]